MRGRGGGGFPTGIKWATCAKQKGRRFIICNADEGEPGTFKDRHYLETRPNAFLEGMLIGAWAVEAEAVYIYLRDEYAGIRALLQRELAALVDRVRRQKRVARKPVTLPRRSRSAKLPSPSMEWTR